MATRFNIEGPLGWRERLRKHAARALDTRVSAVEYFRDQLTEFKERPPGCYGPSHDELSSLCLKTHNVDEFKDKFDEAFADGQESCKNGRAWLMRPSERLGWPSSPLDQAFDCFHVGAAALAANFLTNYYVSRILGMLLSSTHLYLQKFIRCKKNKTC